MDMQKLGKTFGAVALVALSAATLAGCTGEPTEGAARDAAREGGLSGGRIHASHCVVRGYAAGAENPYDEVVYDYNYGAVLLQRGNGREATGYTIMFNAITRPEVQREISNAYRALPAATNCPAPVFTAAPTPMTPGA